MGWRAGDPSGASGVRDRFLLRFHQSILPHPSPPCLPSLPTPPQPLPKYVREASLYEKSAARIWGGKGGVRWAGEDGMGWQPEGEVREPVPECIEGNEG
jgi:hypothetical protein